MNPIKRLARRLCGVGNPDPQRLFQEIAGGYADDMDRYRDFRAVFLSDERGKRVLNEIFAWSHIYRSSAQGRPIDPYQMALREGERSLALRILATLNAEPVERPTQATRNG